jgi:hypothetical protein
MSMDKPDRRWWQHKDSKRCHGGLWKAYEHARSHDRKDNRPDRYRTLRNYYADGVVLHEVGSEATGKIQVSRHNLLASVCDTAKTKILDHRPDPKVLTSGGTTKLQRQAKDLSKWTKAACEKEGMYQVVETAGSEAILNGTGAYRVFERNGRPAYEVVYCDHVFVDPLEAYNDAVMTYYWERYVDREVLLGMFPKAKEHINKTSGVVHTDSSGSEHLPATLAGTSDMVLVVQAYRVATSDAEEDAGRLCIATEQGILHSEAYESEEAPFVFMRWRKRPRSFWGVGIGEMLAGIQYQIDNFAEIIDETLDALPPSVFAPSGSIKRKQMDNGIARLYEYDGATPPTLFAPGAAALQGHTQREQYLSELVYQLAGVSSMEAGAQKPAGLNSGRAQLVHQDIKSTRLRDQIQSVQDAYVGGFERTIMVADRIVEGQRDKDKRGKSRMRYLAGKGKELAELAYPDLRLRDTLYRVTVAPVSKLPDSPAGRMEAVGQLGEMGLPQQTVIRLLDMPDLDAFYDGQYSQQDHARFLVEMALEGKNAAERLYPDSDLAEVMRFGRQMEARAMLRDHASSVEATFAELEPLRDLLAQCAALQKQKMEAEAQAAAPPPQAANVPPPMPGAPPPGPVPPMPPAPMPVPEG